MKKQDELIFLSAPRGTLRLLKRAHTALNSIPRERWSPSACLLEEHMRFLMDCAKDTRVPRRFSSRLPRGEKAARIAEWARSLCWDQSVVLDEKNVRAHLLAWQRQSEWTLQELSFCSVALRCALLEKVMEGARLCIREAKLFRKAEAEVQLLQKGRMLRLSEDKMRLDRIIRCLTDAEDVQALMHVDTELQKRGTSAEKISRDVQEGMVQAQQRLSRAILSIHQLQRIRFDRLTERVSQVYVILKENAHFDRMDRESRGFYAACVQRLSREYCVPETAVARAAVALAEKGEGAQGDTGYYLLEHPECIAEYLLAGKGNVFARQCRENWYVLTLGVPGVLAVIWASVNGWSPWLFLPLALCAGEAGRQLLFPVLRKRFPARLIPRLRVSKIPADKRILVVVPALITGRGHMLKMARHLAVLQCANGSEQVDYMLLGDFRDASQERLPGDEDILLAAENAFSALNEQLPAPGFFALIRERTWQVDQFMGRERKRGALNMLNELIITGKTSDQIRYANFDLSGMKKRYTYVITLDADTFMPPGTVKKLLGAMEHPLQKGRTGVIQPRMAVGADTVRTRAQYFLGGRGGLCMYGGVCQDIYQDLFGKGSFVGKGIYDPALWYGRLDGKLPENRLLSHDLIEGEYAGACLAENLVLYDGHPARLSGFLRRLNRWTRGDWQLLPFLLRRDLSWLSRHKIWDNLRRSLLPMAQVLLFLLSAWLKEPLLLLPAFPWPLHGAFFRLTLLPVLAFVQMDGAIRALWRQFVSHHHMLDWITAAQADGETEQHVGSTLFSIACGAVLIVFSLMHRGMLPCVAAGILWVLAPLAAMFLDGPLEKRKPMREADRRQAEQLSAETWHFFDVFVNESTHFLPPDNVQLSPDKGAAMRTSPTNIGLYLLSCVSARELKLISGAELGKRLNDTLCTLEKLPVWNGIPYNWYDLHTLEVLADEYVSAVDAGNLAVCLLCAAQSARAHLGSFAKEHQSVPARMDAWADGMKLNALYDEKAGLFHVGCHAGRGEMDSAHYDMLGSEARLLSFAAIVKKQVAPSHFFRLDRTMVRAGGGAALLSWGGTLFEYLLPQLLLPLYPGTLLWQGCLHAVRAQIVNQPERPWGISESGYAEFDQELNYQYRAFGLPLLAKSGNTGGQVIAPYASAMALPFFPQAASDNIRRMREKGWRSDYGLYEAADYTPSRMENMPRLVRSHMTHHQGMILCALCNALTDFALVRHLCRIPRIRAYLYLLTEEMYRRQPKRRGEVKKTENRMQGSIQSRFPRDGEPVDVQLMGFHGVSCVMDRYGQGVVKSGRCLWTRFDHRAGMQSGPQTYVWDAKCRELLRPCLGQAQFETGCATFTADVQNMKITEKRTVAPVSGALIVHVRLENRGDTVRDAEVSSFLELALDAENESCPDGRGISVSKADERVLLAIRKRTQDGKTAMLGHMAIGNCAALNAQTDTAAFMENGGTYHCPLSLLHMPEEQISNNPRPCLSFRMRLTVPPGGCAECAFVTVFAFREAEVQQMLLKYEKMSSIREALWLACMAAERRARDLHVDAERQTLYQHLLGASFFSGQMHQQCGEAAPQPEAIGGEGPVVALFLGKQMDALLVRHLLRAHTWFRLQGIWVDAVILYRRETGYQKPLQEQLMQRILSSDARNWLNKPGGIHLVPVREEGAICHGRQVVLRGGQPLRRQLDALRVPRERDVMAGRGNTPDCGALEEYNTFGGFRTDGAYQIVSPPPVYWMHEMSNEAIGMRVCDRGIVHTWVRQNAPCLITDGAGDFSFLSEALTLKTEQGTYELTGGLVTYEAGAAVYETECAGVHAKTEVFVHPHAALVYRRITVRSTGNMQGTLTWRILLKGTDTACMQNQGVLTAQNRMLQGKVFALTDGGDVLKTEGLQATFNRKMELRAKESLVWNGILGFDFQGRMPGWTELDDSHQIRRDAQRMWQQRLGSVQVYTMDEALDRMTNLWLPYQVWNNCYGYGLPDEKKRGQKTAMPWEDLLAMVYLCPEWVREQLVLQWNAFLQEEICAGEQWNALFFVLVLARYVTITGDASILEMKTARGNMLNGAVRDMLFAGKRGTHGMLNGTMGEDTSLTFLAVLAMRAFAGCCDEKDSQKLLHEAECMLSATQEMWTGNMYLPYAGAKENCVHLLPQCLSVLAGASQRQGRRAMEEAWSRLFDGDAGMVKSKEPPDENWEDSAPGMGMNGGQCTRDAVWMVFALRALDEGERAWEVFRALLPDMHSCTEEKARIYRAEPYRMADEVYVWRGMGRGGSTCCAGSAGSMYWALLEGLLGFEKKGNRVTLHPGKGFPEREVTLLYRFGEGIYHLTCDRHAVYLTLDGKRQEESEVILSSEKGTHEARFPMHRYG